MDKKVKQFYASSKNYLERLKKHDENGYARYIELCRANINFGASILECGCGVGLSSYLLAKEGFKVTAVDVSPLFISEAKKKYGEQPDLKFIVGNVEHMSFPGQTFDAVCSIILLEHLTDVKRTLKEMCRVLKNEGLLIIDAPNFLDPVQHLTAYIQGKEEEKHKPWEAKTRIGDFFQFIRITCVVVGKALGINKKIYYLKPILSNEESFCGQDFDATWLSNRFDVSNILSELGFSVQCLFPYDTGGKTIQIMRVLGLPEIMQSSYKRMRASGFVIVGKKK